MLRKSAGVLSYAFAVIGGALALAGVLYAQGFRMRHANTGDFTGAAFLESSLVFGVVPLTLIALAAAIWLVPPRGRAGRPAHRAEAGAPEIPPPASTDMRRILGVLLVVFAVGYGVLVWRRSGMAIPPEAHAGSLTNGGLLFLALCFLPTILMTIVLLLAALRLVRSRA